MRKLLLVVAMLTLLIAASPIALAKGHGGGSGYLPRQYSPTPCQYGTDPLPPECRGTDGCDDCPPLDPPGYEAAPEVPASVADDIGEDTGGLPSSDAAALNEALEAANDARSGGGETAQAVEGVAIEAEAAEAENVETVETGVAKTEANAAETETAEPRSDGAIVPETTAVQTVVAETEAPEDAGESTGEELAGGAEPRKLLSNSGALPFALLGAFAPLLIATGILLRRFVR